ncbi:hypothetical protein B0T11DRAFT_282424 [Plectosphaerella cucumerina]|uniref:SnoaL-like domain-containing protein n=1 Tax=Plectosphaerella cucumerina TaxID=40658 RepID=A0A8K0TJK8_9PEZI|nr:hypothetical protein B0T11DRAFT_282424 [Plectosphaerella cucumerina]
MAASTAPKYTPRQILDKFYEAERIYTLASAEERTFEPIAAVLADDFYMEQSSALPWAGEYHGPQQFEAWLKQASEWVGIDVKDVEIFENNESNRIVVLSKIYHTCHKTGEKIDLPLSQTFIVDREKGVIKEIRPFYWDIKKLNKAMGYNG